MKIFGKFVGWILKLILILMLVTIIVPVGYLAWRAGQPMELAQFNGLTYYQYMSWRKTALRQMAVEYQATHPNAKMGGGLDMCYRVDAAGDIGLKMPLAGIYSLAGIYPAIKTHLNQADVKSDLVPTGITLITFLPSWWGIYEKLVWSSANYAPHTSVAYCRLQPNFPTPEEYQVMQSDLAKGVNP